MKRQLTGSNLLRNRTYVMRATRMSPHQRMAYSRLRTRFVLNPEERRFTPAELNLTGSEERVILDVGFGMGHALADLAEANPTYSFVGIEVYRPGVGKLMSELERRSLDNVRILEHDGVDAFRSLLPFGAFDGIHIFFPDPWPKKKHQKRRLVQEGFPELIRPLLKSHGYLYLVTDWEDYAHQMLAVMDAAEGFANPHGGFAPRQSWRPETAFERKGKAAGHCIFELIHNLTD